MIQDSKFEIHDRWLISLALAVSMESWLCNNLLVYKTCPRGVIALNSEQWYCFVHECCFYETMTFEIMSPEGAVSSLELFENAKSKQPFYTHKP